MTRYQVVWGDSVIDDLARFWMKTSEKQAITDAAAMIDEQLAVDASTKGEPLSEELRALTAGLLRAYFVVHEDDRIVVVTYVRRIVR